MKRINGILISPSLLPKVIAFQGHEKDLLSCLREAYERGPERKPFDETKALRDLTSRADLYFAGQETPKTIPAAERVKRLRKFANALGSARRARLVPEGLDVDLAAVSIAQKNIPLPSRAAVDELTSINKMITSLATLERLARKASDNVRAKRGRRRGGAVLSVDHVHGLASIYRQSTGRKPSVGEGPFARFVRAFLTAIGEGDRLKDDYVVEMIETARNQIRDGHPDWWAISAFNPNGGNNSVRFS
jgi:hypothetical protein